MYVGEIAASSTGDENFLPGAFRAFKHSNSAAALAGLNRAHKASSTRSENQDIKVVRRNGDNDSL
jgi:hypothetical protein